MNPVRYAQVWEDADALLAALDVRPGGTYVSIASAGDNAIALLARSPGRVIAVDMNPAQLACVALRLAGYRVLEHGELLQLLGFAPGGARERAALYARCRAALSADARTFWDARPADIAAGFGTCGRFERYLALFRTRLLPLVHRRSTVHALLAPRSTAERARFFAERWDTWGWRALFRVFFSRAVMGALGREPRFFAQAEGAVSERILARIEHALRDGDVVSNPYVRFALTGTFGARLPFALRPENFSAIRANAGRLELRCSTLQDLVAANDLRVDGWNLSDVFEYVNDAEYAAMLHRIAAASTPGARLAYWNMLVPRRRPAALAPRLNEREDVAAPLRARDQVPFYGDFVVEEVR